MTSWIDGDWVAGLGRRRVKTNPVSGDMLWYDSDTDVTQVTQTCQIACAASVGWAKQFFSARQTIVKKPALLLESDEVELIQIITKETGKPHWEAATELTAIINKIAIFIKACHARTGEQHSELPNGAAILRHRLYGMLAVFSPYNFPGHLPDGHIVSALLAGSTLIFGPSELTLQTDKTVTRLQERAELPPGVLNPVQGRHETGQALSALEDPDGLLFTNNVNTGYQLHKQLSGQPKKILALEMGGGNSLITENPKDIDAAMHLTIQSAFITAGQRCTCTRRLLVKKGAQGNASLTRLVRVSQCLVPGNWNVQP